MIWSVVAARGARSRRTLALSALAVLCLAGCGSGNNPCAAVPETPPLVAAGAAVHVPVGAVIWVELVEYEKYSSTAYPRGFPWLTPTSADRNVLKPVPLCTRRAMYSLPVSLTAFRAVGRGNATLLAKLAPPWRGRSPGIQRYQADVMVGH